MPVSNSKCSYCLGRTVKCVIKDKIIKPNRSINSLTEKMIFQLPAAKVALDSNTLIHKQHLSSQRSSWRKFQSNNWTNPRINTSKI